MAAHRYWRVFAVTGAGSVVAAGEVEMRESIGGADECTGGTAIASSTFGGFTEAAAFDGNLSTAWAATTGTNEWLGYDFGVGVEKEIIEIAWTAREGIPTQALQNGHVDWSDDGVTWTEDWPHVFENFIEGVTQIRRKEAGSYGAEPHRFWRINAATLSNTVVGVEVELRGTPSGPDLTGNGRTSCTGFGPPELIFNNNNSTLFQIGTPGSITYDFGEGAEYTVEEFWWKCRGGGQPEQSPNSGNVSYSDDGSSWTEYWTWVLPVATVDGQELVATNPGTPPPTGRRRQPLIIF